MILQPAAEIEAFKADAYTSELTTYATWLGMLQNLERPFDSSLFLTPMLANTWLCPALTLPIVACSRGFQL